ncbi:MAG: hypothetical protein ABIH34_01665, partial [Nanoarchaeota archaeon]
DTLYADIIWAHNQTIPAMTYTDDQITILQALINSLPLGNSSFNQTLTDTLYADIIWGYNQTIPALTYTDQEIAVVDLRIDNLPVDNSSFNQSLTDVLYISADDEQDLNVNSSSWWGKVTSWVEGWFIQDGDQLNFNETKLDERIATQTTGKLDVTDQRYNDTAYVDQEIGVVNTRIDDLPTGNNSFNQSLTDMLYADILWSYNQTVPAMTYTDEQIILLQDIIDALPSGNTSFNQTLTDTLYIPQSEEQDLNVNASSWWATLSGWTSGWFTKQGDKLTFNETKLNESITSGLSEKLDETDQRYNDTTYVDQIITDYHLNWSSIFNETNATKAGIGDCPEGEFVQNTTSTGVSCAPLVSTETDPTETDPAWTRNLTQGVSNNLRPLSTLTYDFGSSTREWLTGWFSDLEVSNNIVVAENLTASKLIGNLEDSTFPSSACSGSDKAIGIQADGTVDCGPDQQGGSSSWRISQEFLTLSSLDPFVGSSVALGIIEVGASGPDHPGVVKLTDSTKYDGGYSILTDTSAFLINGTEEATFTFRDVSSKITTQYRLGFQDQTSVNSPTNGCWISVTANILTGKCGTSAGTTGTSTGYALMDSMWYIARISVNSAASVVTFTVSDSTNTLWTGTVSSNIPTETGQETGFGVLATESTRDAGEGIIELDYMSLGISRSLNR